MIYSQYALFMLRVFELVQNAAFKYYTSGLNLTSEQSDLKWPSSKQDGSRRRRTARLWGHIEVGALFPIHRKTHGTDSCGEIWEQYGIHRSEVAMYTVDEINKRGLIGPGVMLGIHIRDDCWTERIAMEQSIEFIRDAWGRRETHSRTSSEKCSPDDAPKSSAKGFPPNLAAVVGPGSSDPSIAVQNLLQVFKIPQIGYSATTKDLSDKIEFKYYMRVVPSDLWQARALIDLVRHFDWTFIAVVYSADPDVTKFSARFAFIFKYCFNHEINPSQNWEIYTGFQFFHVVKTKMEVLREILSCNYGEKGHEELAKYIEESSGGKLCMEVQEKIKSLAPEEDYDTLLKTIVFADPKPQVAVCFCEGATITEILKATKRFPEKNAELLRAKNITNTGIQWIGSDSWSDRRDVVHNYENEAFGGISLKIYSPTVPEFDDYFLNLSPFTNQRNPWFVDFWEEKFKCSLRNSTFPLYKRACTGKESLHENYEQDPKLSQVINSIYTVAYGMSSMYNETCYDWFKNRRRNRLTQSNNTAAVLCPQMNPINGSLLYQHMRRVRFEDFSGQEIYFDEHGDPPARYDILNYQGPEKGYVLIGAWKQYQLVDTNSTDNKIRFGARLTINRRDLMWYNGRSAVDYVPRSVCADPCELGSIKQIQQLQQCCWNCIPCFDDQYVYDEKTCKPCALGSWPNENRTGCYELTAEYMRWNSAEALVSMVLAFLGIVATSYATFVFARYNSTPVVKSTTRELSYIILLGFFMCYSTTFVIVLKPSRLTCYFLRIVPGIAFATIYGALLTKTNRIARILAGSKKRILTKKPRFMSTGAQLAITAVLVGVELAIIIAILIYEPATAQHDYNMPRRVLLVCKTTTLSFLAPYGFDFLLVSSCTFYAVKTRNLPENFNEAKFIGFTMYTTCVIWLAFCTIYFGSNNKGITMSINFTLSATVALVLLFFPKLYIIIFKPERNVRSSYATTQVIRCHFGGVSNSKASDEQASRSLSSIRTIPSNRPSAVSGPSNSRNGTDSGIELNGLKYKKTQIRDPLQASLTSKIGADETTSRLVQEASSPELQLSRDSSIRQKAGEKTPTGQSPSPSLQKSSKRRQMSPKSHYLSQFYRSLSSGHPGPADAARQHLKSATMADFEPNELSTIEESGSHDESSVSTTANNVIVTGSTDKHIEYEEISQTCGDEVRGDGGLARMTPEVVDHASKSVSRSCQTDLDLLIVLLDATTVSNQKMLKESHRGYESGRQRQKSLMQTLFKDYSDEVLPVDDSYESLLAARLRCMELEEKKMLEKQRSMSSTSAEKLPHHSWGKKKSSVEGVSLRRTSEPEPVPRRSADTLFAPDDNLQQAGVGSPTKTDLKLEAVHKKAKKHKPPPGLTDLLARGIEGSLHAVLGTVVGSGLSAPQEQQRQGRAPNAAVAADALQTTSANTNINAVPTPNIYTMPKMTDRNSSAVESTAILINSSNKSSSSSSSSRDVVSSSASKASAHSATSSIMLRVGDSLRRSLKRFTLSSNMRDRQHTIGKQRRLRRGTIAEAPTSVQGVGKRVKGQRGMSEPCVDVSGFVRTNKTSASTNKVLKMAANNDEDNDDHHHKSNTILPCARRERNLIVGGTLSSPDAYLPAGVSDTLQHRTAALASAPPPPPNVERMSSKAADSQRKLPVDLRGSAGFSSEKSGDEAGSFNAENDFSELASVFHSRGLKARELSRSTVV